MLFNKLSLVTIAAYAVQSTTAASIFGIANTTEGFETLAAAVSAAGLADTLSGDGTFTVFAPANSAFDALPSGLVEQLLKPEWLPHLTDVLLYHTLGSKVMSGDLSDGDVTAINDGTLTINTDPPSVNDIAIIAPIDAEADNGVVHGIESVLTPSWISTDIVDIGAGDDMFSTLVAAVQAAGLVDALKGPGPLTLFAPTNDAFAALPEGTLDDLLLPENKEKLGDILKYHVVAGNVPSTSLENGMVPTLLGEKVKVDLTDGAKINGANVISPDVLANNGMIHVIDAVLIPPNDADSPDDAAKTPDAPVDAAPAETAAPTKAPTKMPTAEESGAIAHGATVAAVAAVVAGVFSIA
mmetsp:Transcript_11427/g.28156  ORF Transcript_11427/g.28156 Transcript_11427/m.28156 type:complete len:354 (+) Transcript_11427:107-1168(+)